MAARGIHVDDVATVVHFDPPNDHKDYLHRSGRTARAGAAGTVVSLVTGGQRRSVKRMQKELELDAPIAEARIDELHEGGRFLRPPAPSMRKPEARRPAADSKTERASSRRRHAGEPRSRDGATVDERTERISGTTSQRGHRPKPMTGPTESIYVANLPWGTTERQLTELFARHGDVRETTIIRNRRNGRSKGFGFVDMPRPAARIAVGALHGATLDGRELTVRVAKPRRN